MSNVFSEIDFEILIATQDRADLNFLEPMFPFEHFSTFNILIINQSEKTILKSDYKFVRVINIAEKGLARSRNMAIDNAEGKICLIADDDVVFEENFNFYILSAFEEFASSAIITFNHFRIGDTFPQKKWKQAFVHNLKSIQSVNSIEIAFRLDEIKHAKIRFNENFGLGSFFETAEEYLFLKLALQQKQKVYFCPISIATHPQFSSGKDEGSDTIIYARAALFCHKYGILVYGWLVKYLFFLIKNKYIEPFDFFKKYRIGMAGIKKFKLITKQQNDKKCGQSINRNSKN
nr:glycosyltransferase family A protein [uncultured Flavobacterium sp.]